MLHVSCMECIFCKIINKELPSKIVYEDDKTIVINDINPKAPVHILIIPKKHISSISSLEIQDKELIGDLIWVAKNIAEEKKLEGYKLLFNVGKEGGQIVDHIHLHLLSNKI